LIATDVWGRGIIITNNKKVLMFNKSPWLLITIYQPQENCIYIE